MSDEDYEWERYIDDEVERARPRDSRVDEVKKVLVSEFLGKDAGEVVYYGRQLEVQLAQKGCGESGRIDFDTIKTCEFTASIHIGIALSGCDH